MIALSLVLSASAAEHRYALVVGHDIGDADEVALLFAERDARRVADVLVELGGVPATNLVLLEGPEAGQVEGAIGRLETELAALPEDDQVVVFVYYSGHADASSLHLGGTRLGLGALEDGVRGLSADARVMVLDACRTGELTRQRGGQVVDAFEIVVEEPSDAHGIAIITSAAAGEDAHESDRLGGGVFTHHLLSGLRGAADSSGEGDVTLNEVYRYAFDRTVATTSTAPTLQHPSFSFDLAGTAELVLTRTADVSEQGRVQAQLDGHYLLFDPRGRELVAEFEVPAGATFVVAPGEYLVRKRTPSRLREGELVVVAGQTTPIEGLKSVPLGQATRRGGEQDRYALAAHVGGGWVGPLLDEQSYGPSLAAGVRLETAWMTAIARARYSRSQTENVFLTQTQTLVGGELLLTRLLDVRRVSLGPQVGLGLDRVSQVHETDGQAEDGVGMAGRVGPAVRVEVGVAPRLTLGVVGGVDIALYQEQPLGEDPRLTTQVVPSVSLDADVWLR